MFWLKVKVVLLGLSQTCTFYLNVALMTFSLAVRVGFANNRVGVDRIYKDLFLSLITDNHPITIWEEPEVDRIRNVVMANFFSHFFESSKE